MVMMAGVGVETRCVSQMVGSADRAHLDERLKRSVNRGARDLGHAGPHFLMHLISGRMILPLQDAFENHTPLHREGKAAPAAHLLKRAQSIGKFWRT